MENGEEDVELFNSKVLEELDFSCCSVTFPSGISFQYPGPSLCMRPLNSGDFERGYIKLLSELTVVGDVSKDLYLERFHGMKNSSGAYFVTVIEDTSSQEIVAAATLEIEQKFIRHCAIRGRIEEVVVLEKWRGKQLGKLLIAALTMLSQKLGCYKTSLECSDNNIPFYQKFGYKEEGQHYLVKRNIPK